MWYLKRVANGVKDLELHCIALHCGNKSLLRTSETSSKSLTKLKTIRSYIKSICKGTLGIVSFDISDRKTNNVITGANIKDISNVRIHLQKENAVCHN